MKKGKFIIVVGPTGSGKNSMIDLFLENHKGVSEKVLSATTRSMREGEPQNNPYVFLSREEFEEKIRNDELLEYAFVHSQNYYGVLKERVLDGIKEGKIVLNDVDYQGLESIKKKLSKDDFISVFLLPPTSKEALRKRIESRGEKMTDEDFNFRLKSMEKEMKIANTCDFQLEPIEGDIVGTYKKFEEVILKSLNQKES